MAKGMTGLRSPQRKHVQARRTEDHMQTSLRGIANRAKLDSRHRFGGLYGLLNGAHLHWCFGRLNRKAAPGVDDVDWQEYAADLDQNIDHLVNDLKGHRYRARLVRRHYIPKGQGRRALGIPVVGDKLLQACSAEILNAIFEQDFLVCSHGYRRKHGPRKAALELSQRLHRGRFGWVVDADITGFFDHIDHAWMIRMLAQRINDRRFLQLIRKWLKAGILEEDGQVLHPVTGTPQGGVISAVLANIYLHFALDLWFERVVKPRCQGSAIMMRYADDFVCCFQYANDARRFLAALTPRLAKFNLTLSVEKTQLIRFTRFETKGGDTFTFLGFTYRWGLSRTGRPLVRMATSSEKFTASLQAMTAWLRSQRCRLRSRELFATLARKVRGHCNYYGVSGNMLRLDRWYSEVRRLVFKWLNRRSQRRSCNWTEFNVMWQHFGIPRPCITGYWE